MRVLHSALVNISPGLEELLDSEQISLTCSCEEIHHNNNLVHAAATKHPQTFSLVSWVTIDYSTHRTDTVLVKVVTIIEKQLLHREYQYNQYNTLQLRQGRG